MNMNTHSLVRILSGFAVIIFGMLALLGGLNVIDFGQLFDTYWPLILVLVGFFTLLGSPRDWAWPGILILAGAALQLRELSVLDFNIWALIWPTIIIAVGLSIIVNGSRTRSGKTDSANAIMSGHNLKNQSDDYQGGHASAVLGGVKLDLSEAKITKDASLDVFAFMGGIEIIVPKDWVVESRVMPIMGGVENKAPVAKDKKSPRLILTGQAVMGGIEIKHS
jgi:predicted membrane protein